MKLRTFFAFALFLLVSFLHAQEGFYYQAAIRNTDGSPIRKDYSREPNRRATHESPGLRGVLFIATIKKCERGVKTE